MQSRLLVGLLVLLFLESCGKIDQQKEITPEGGSITLWTQKIELFMEHPALVVGKEARFAAHLTRLSDFKPCVDEAVQFRFRSEDGATIEQTVEKPAPPGIYRPSVTFSTPGSYNLTMIITRGVHDTLHVANIQVFPSIESIPSSQESGPAEQLVSFLKEQQWKIDFRTERIERRMISQAVQAAGEIMARKDYDVIVSAPFAGTLQPEHNNRIPVVGASTQRGSVLVTLTSAAQTVDGGENFAALYAEAEGEYKLAKSEYERSQQLYQNGSISVKEFDQAETSYNKAGANFEAFSRSVQRDTVNPQLPHEYNFLLRAPISGTIAETYYVLGKQFPPGDPLFRIVNTSIVWLRASVPVGEIGKISNPRRAEFHVAGMPGRFEVHERNGRLISVGSVVDERTRSVPVIFEVTNPKGVLRIGMYAEVSVMIGDEAPVIAVPETALLEEEGTYAVYVHVQGESFARREVSLGGSDRGWIEIRSGLQSGERVVTVGAYQVRLASLLTQLPAHGHEH
jgi:RND family efflux transporter MFP subunit